MKTKFKKTSLQHENKQIIRLGKSTLNLALAGLVLSSATVLAEVTDNEVLSKPAYTLKIIAHGEGSNRSDNYSDEDKQDNRRADISLETKVPSGFEVITETENVKTQVKVSEATNRSIKLSDGGVIWVTKDPASITPTLDVVTSTTAEFDGSKFVNPISFSINTNYSTFIDSWELNVYKKNSDKKKAIATFMGNTLANQRTIKWNGTSKHGELGVGDKLEYVLSVKNNEGHSDETFSRNITLIGSDRNINVEKADQHTNIESNLKRQTIPIHGSKVRIFGRDIAEGNKISINGDSVNLLENKFVIEKLLPEGKHQFDIEITDTDKKVYSKVLAVELSGKYMFMVGLADVTIGEGDISGNLETLSDGDKHLDGDIFIDGRLAFYLKGKIKGKYLVTAQMDTGTEKIEDLFDDIHKKDSRSIFRRLDPDKYYPVYGDDSTLIDDTDSQGKIYVRVDWDKSRAIWGNYNTDMTGTELSSFNRSLYGAKINHKNTKVTKDGDHKTDVTVFASEAQSAFKHNQFLGTGGSLYYLKDSDIVEGSEKVWIEVRERGASERVIEKVVLEEGRDYEIDDFQGRIILHRPLLQIANQTNPSLIKDTPLEGNQVYLMVDYEYVPSDFDSNKASYGSRGKVWLNDHVAVGGTYVHENRDDKDYDMKGVDITLQKAKGTYLKGEYAKSESTQTRGSFLSEDGGLNFNPFNDNSSADKKGNAFSIEARANLSDISKREGSIAAWYKQRDAGFSSAQVDNGVDTTDAGVEAIVEATEKLQTSVRATLLDKKSESKKTALSIQADYERNSKTTVSAEMRHVKEVDEVDTSKSGKGTLGAFKVGYDVNDKVNLYGTLQATLNKKGGYEENNLLTLGAKATINSRLKLNAEVSSGNRGDGALIGAEYKVSDDYNVYTNYALSTDRTDNKRNIFTVGQKKSVSDQLKVYTEHQFTHEDKQSGIGHTFGLDYQITKELNANASVQTARLESAENGQIDRDAFSVGLNYKLNQTQASTRLEYRKDRGENNERTEQWVTTNRINHRLSPALRLQGKFNYSETKDLMGNTKDAKFVEAGFGFALRPIYNDRLNILGRLTYLYDLQPIAQSDNTDEKSLIASLETSYQINQKWEVGGKIAHRKSEIRTDRNSGSWSDNDATLAATRVRYHLTKKWDAMVQYHWMNSNASDDTQHGAMISVDRHVGDNMKLGIGYNFTDFNDDLSDQNGSAKGWFINLVGKF